MSVKKRKRITKRKNKKSKKVKPLNIKVKKIESFFNSIGKSIENFLFSPSVSKKEFKYKILRKKRKKTKSKKIKNQKDKKIKIKKKRKVKRK